MIPVLGAFQPTALSLNVKQAYLVKERAFSLKSPLNFIEENITRKEAHYEQSIRT
jgi:hypothetical protein